MQAERTRAKDSLVDPELKRRIAAALAIGLFGALMAFAAGARASATLDGRVMSLSVARIPMPQASLHAR